MSVERKLRALESELGEFLERHDDAKGLDSYQRYADDPVAFAEEELGFTPWEPNQRAIFEAVRDDPQVLVQGGNSTGKDAATAVLAAWWVYARGGTWLTTAATERQGQDVWMEEFARWFRRAPQLPGELYRGSLRIPGEETAGIYVFTSTSAGRLSGFHAPRVAALFSEAQEIESWGWEGLMSCAAGPEDRIIATGNPLRPEGKFYEFARSDDWTTIKIPVHDHPNLRDGEQTIPGGPSPGFVERMAASFGGESSPIFRARIDAEFPEGSSEGLFRRSWLDAAAERWKREPTGEEEPVVAVDPARFGVDSTVMAVRRGQRIEKLVSWSQADTMETTERVADQLSELGVEPRNEDGLRWLRAKGAPSHKKDRYKGRGQVVVDTIGIGAGVADRLKERGYNVEGFKGSRSPREEERFANLRAEGYWRLRDQLEDGEVSLPPDEGLFDELLSIHWRPTTDGRVQIEGKSEIKKRLGRSPDRADAAVMALWPKARGRTGKVRVVHY